MLFRRLGGVAAVDDLVHRVEQSRSELLDSLTLRDLLTREGREATPKAV
jgi:hypothetical protein